MIPSTEEPFRFTLQIFFYCLSIRSYLDSQAKESRRFPELGQKLFPGSLSFCLSLFQPPHLCYVVLSSSVSLTAWNTIVSSTECYYSTFSSFISPSFSSRFRCSNLFFPNERTTDKFKVDFIFFYDSDLMVSLTDWQLVWGDRKRGNEKLRIIYFQVEKKIIGKRRQKKIGWPKVGEPLS